MSRFYDSLSEDKKKYFEILEPNFPEWLHDYIDTEEMLKQQYISLSCGTVYSDLFGFKYFYSSLDHAIAVALIVWHFTHSKKETLAGLFHDIATPVFKHCVDYLNGDYITQESTEDLTNEIIKNSKEITALLKRDKIRISEVDNYHLYPIADNDIPRLSADRLEYSLSSAMFLHKFFDLKGVKKIYDDLEVQLDDDNIPELGFRTPKMAEGFLRVTSQLSITYREDKTRYSMQLLADIMKRLCEEKIISKADLYKLKEEDVINIIESSKYADVFDIWKKAKVIHTSKVEPKNVYFVHHGSKVRYIDPLCRGVRISKSSKFAKELIENNLAYDMDKYVYLDKISQL